MMMKQILRRKTNEDKSSVPYNDAVLNLLNVIANDFMFDVVQHANSQKNPKNMKVC